jgi:predicted Zn-ribbon and HTH transcriptional regulator
MIRIVLGNIGSGKTASTVRWMKENKNRHIFTNIDVKGKDFKHVIKLQPEMIIVKDIIGYKKDGEAKYEYRLNQEYWKEQIKKLGSIHVIIDEAHTFFNPRRSMSKVNVIMTDFLALLRRVIGSADGSDGELVLITQLQRRLDIIAKEMSTHVQFHVHHYFKFCKKCGFKYYENNETAHKPMDCPKCGYWNIKKINNKIEVFEFKNIDDYNNWKDYGTKSYYGHYMINDIQKIFGNYNTLQWGDLLSNY